MVDGAGEIMNRHSFEAVLHASIVVILVHRLLSFEQLG